MEPRGLARGCCGDLVLPTLILPLARLFAWIRTEGLENLRDLKGPVIFAVESSEPFRCAGDLLGVARAVAIPRGARDGEGVFRRALSSRRGTPRCERFTSSLNYYLSCTGVQCVSAAAARGRHARRAPLRG